MKASDDLIDLDCITDDTVYKFIEDRFSKEQIYTWLCGSPQKDVLVAVNPFKKISKLESPENKEFYFKRFFGISTRNLHSEDITDSNCREDLPPHTYALFSTALDSLLNENRRQSVIVSGDSGSGKTYATEQCFQFLKYCCEAFNNRQLSTSRSSRRRNKIPSSVHMANVGKTILSIENMLIQASIILEAFGNAKTQRNDNSSRFGKWVELHFDPKDNKFLKVNAAKIDFFLLESSRVTYQHKGEMNYHIFYQLLRSPLAEKYALSKHTSFKFLRNGFEHLESVRGSCERLQRSFEMLDFDEASIGWIFKLIAGILLLGNIELSEGSSTGFSDNLQKASELLGFKSESLLKCLTTKELNVKEEVISIPMSRDDCERTRGALAKLTYRFVFKWLADSINQKLNISGDGRTMGILDIFGFENINHNSLEQLCINYTNETLEKLFEDNLFEDEDELYKVEGIVVNNNIPRSKHEAIQSLHFIFDTIDELCFLEGNTKVFMARLQASKTSMKDALVNLNASEFQIAHYSGLVKYCVKDMLRKNYDSASSVIYDLLRNSHDERTKELLPEKEHDSYLDFQHRKKLSKSRLISFRQDLDALMEKLKLTRNTYIKCIKSNSEMKPLFLDRSLTIKQLKASAVVLALKLRANGYPYRLLQSEFVSKYQCFLKQESAMKNLKVQCQTIIESAFGKLCPDKVQIGSLRVFMKSRAKHTLELIRMGEINRNLPKIQALIRRWIAVKEFQSLKLEIVKLEHVLASDSLDTEKLREILCQVPKSIAKSPKILVVKLIYEELIQWKNEKRELLSSDRINQHYERLESLIGLLPPWAVQEREALLKHLKVPSVLEFLNDPDMDISQLGYDMTSCKSLQERAEKSIRRADCQLLSKLLSAAKAKNFKLPAIREAKALLDLREQNLLNRQLEHAKSCFDTFAHIKAELGLQQIVFDKMLLLYPSWKDDIFSRYAEDITSTIPNGKPRKTPLRILGQCKESRQRIERQENSNISMLSETIKQTRGQNHFTSNDNETWKDFIVEYVNEGNDISAVLLIELLIQSRVARPNAIATIIKALDDNRNFIKSRGVELLTFCLAFFPLEEKPFRRFVYTWLGLNLSSVKYHKLLVLSVLSYHRELDPETEMSMSSLLLRKLIEPEVESFVSNPIAKFKPPEGHQDILYQCQGLT